MLISELSFPHLQAAREAQLAQELERRRIVRERLADVSEHPLAASSRGPSDASRSRVGASPQLNS